MLVDIYGGDSEALCDGTSMLSTSTTKYVQYVALGIETAILRN